MAKVNVYKIFFDWLFDGNKNSDIPEEVLENTSSFSIHFMINMFMKLKKVCLFMNKYVNTYEFVGLDFRTQILSLKEIVINYRLTKQDIMYSKFEYHNISKEILEIAKRYPHIKISEIEFLYNEFKEYINNDTNKIKKRKTKKSIKEKINYKQLIDYYLQNKNCNCPLINQPMVLFDTNRKSNCYNIDYMFISYRPYNSDTKKNICFSDKKYQPFKKLIQSNIVKKRKSYFLTNFILCYSPVKDLTPIENNCSIKIVELINHINPKKIILLGYDISKAIGLNDIEFGQEYFSEFFGRNVLILPHPFILNNGMNMYISQFFDNIK